jgi:hypothetical protein
MRSLEWKSGQDHDQILRGLREVDGPVEDIAPFTPRRRKDAVDQESLNAEITGDERSPRSRALSAIAESDLDLVAELKCINREQRRELLDYQRSAAGWMRERAQLIAANADRIEQITVLEAAIAGISEQRDGALMQSAELLDANVRLTGVLRQCVEWLPIPSELRNEFNDDLRALLASIEEVLRS